MAMTKQSVVLTQPTTGTIRIAVGPETFTMSVEEIKKIWNGLRDPSMLIFQFHVVLQAAGVDPNTSTPAQIKTAIEAQTYWWGSS